MLKMKQNLRFELDHKMINFQSVELKKNQYYNIKGQSEIRINISEILRLKSCFKLGRLKK